MGGRAAGVGLPILFGIYLIYSNLSKSKLFVQGPEADLHTALAALGAFLLVLGVVFLYKNLR
jgi:hypothetical protein